MSKNKLKPWQRFQKEYGQGSYYGQSTGESVAFHTEKSGYEVWSTNKSPDGYDNFSVHILTAIMGGEDPYEVFAENTNVHHKNGIPWDNRPENLEVMDRREHARLHAYDRIDKGTFPVGGKNA